ncbi:type II restriction endonuclease [Dolichospermum sp. ST_sed9]|nr:type II restriction endonuclease [Dolichospermum sp. ST_sed9]
MTLWDYFVNWQKVLTNIQDIEIHLNTINYLVGKYPHCKNYLTKKKSKLFNF